MAIMFFCVCVCVCVCVSEQEVSGKNNHDFWGWSFYTPQSGSRSGAAWGREVCLSGPRPSSPPSYIQRRHPGSRRLSSGSWWRTAPPLTSSLPALPAGWWRHHGSKVTVKPNCQELFGFRWFMTLTLPKLPFPSRARKLKSFSRTRSMLPEGRLNRR